MLYNKTKIAYSSKQTKIDGAENQVTYTPSVQCYYHFSRNQTFYLLNSSIAYIHDRRAAIHIDDVRTPAACRLLWDVPLIIPEDTGTRKNNF